MPHTLLKVSHGNAGAQGVEVANVLYDSAARAKTLVAEYDMMKMREESQQCALSIELRAQCKLELGNFVQMRLIICTT